MNATKFSTLDPLIKGLGISSMAGMDSSYRLEKVTPLLETSRTTPSENFRVYLVLRNNCFWRKRKKSYRLNFGKSQKCGILSLFILTISCLLYRICLKKMFRRTQWTKALRMRHRSGENPAREIACALKFRS